MATAAATKTITKAEWEVRAIVLASEAHLVNRPRHIGQNDQGAQLWQVPSRTHDGVYVVTVWPLSGRVLCSCTAGSWSRACGHAGAVILAERQRTATSTVSEQWSWWLSGGHW